MKSNEFDNRDFELSGNNQGMIQGNYNQLIERIREMEIRRRKELLVYGIILFFMAILYLSLGRDKSASGLKIISAGFVAGAIFLFIRSRSLSQQHFLLPTALFMEVAEKRLRYLPLNDLLFTIPILLILGIGGGIHFIQRLMNYTHRFWLLLAIWAILYTALCIWGYYAGRKEWAKKYGKLHQEIHQLRKALQEEPENGDVPDQ